MLNLKKLDNLKLTNNNINEIPSGLFSNLKLLSLELNSNKINKLDIINCIKMNRLDLNRNKLTNIDISSNCSYIRFFIINNNDIDLSQFDFDLNNELLIVDLSSIKNFNAKKGSEIGAKLQKVFIDSSKIEKMKSLVNTRILSEHIEW